MALRIGAPRAASPTIGRSVKPKTEPKQEPVEEEAPEYEWLGLKEAEEASFNTVQPAEDGFAEEWSRAQFTAEEMEIQRKLLAEAERSRAVERQRAAAAAAFLLLWWRRRSRTSSSTATAMSAPSRDAGEGTSKAPGGDYSQAIRNSLGL